MRLHVLSNRSRVAVCTTAAILTAGSALAGTSLTAAAQANSGVQGSFSVFAVPGTIHFQQLTMDPTAGSGSSPRSRNSVVWAYWSPSAKVHSVQRDVSPNSRSRIRERSDRAGWGAHRCRQERDGKSTGRVPRRGRGPAV
jgi:hypothetical protein